MSVGCSSRLTSRMSLLGVLEVALERRVEAAHRRDPVLLALLDLVELAPPCRGELDVEDVGERSTSRSVTRMPSSRRAAAASRLSSDVLLVEDRRHDRGVGRRAADALLLELLDERRLGEARRRLGEVLLGHQLVQRQASRPRVSVGQLALRSSSSSSSLRSSSRPSVYTRMKPANFMTWPVARKSVSAGGDVDRGLVEDRRHHLAGDEAVPDQRVERRARPSRGSGADALRAAYSDARSAGSPRGRPARPSCVL